ncbi:hypothetical protein AC578_844 [Pseudocercospora eumusae]|uniref:Uncharacterized protein n=1 Tax=Pseudocercospora eumusae TaxID=321146 RepID=A0A139GZV7_9PEZI|nr:hypothetical protein AC578_844 [Pseudocercospora eumusae]
MAASTAKSDLSSRNDDLSLQYKIDAAINDAISRGDPDLAVNMAQTHINSFGNEEIRSMLNNALCRASREEDRQRLEAYQSKLRKRYVPGVKHKKPYVRDTYQNAGLMRLLMRLRQEGKAKTEQRVAESLAMDLKREYSDDPIATAEGRVEEPHKGTQGKDGPPDSVDKSSDGGIVPNQCGLTNPHIDELMDKIARRPEPTQCSDADAALEDDLVYSPPKVMMAKPREHTLDVAKEEEPDTANLSSNPPIPSEEPYTPSRPEPPQKCEIQSLHSAVITEPRKRRYDIHGILLPETAEERELVKRYLAKKRRSDRRERLYGVRKRR